jgi:hypothetical protein
MVMEFETGSYRQAQVGKTYFPLISDVFGSLCVYVSLETTDVALSVSTADLSRFFFVS